MTTRRVLLQELRLSDWHLAGDAIRVRDRSSDLVDQPVAYTRPSTAGHPDDCRGSGNNRMGPVLWLGADQRTAQPSRARSYCRHPLSIRYPNPDVDGTFWVDWSDVLYATNYTLEEADNLSFQSAATRYSGSETALLVTDRPVAPGTTASAANARLPTRSAPGAARSQPRWA